MVKPCWKPSVEGDGGSQGGDPYGSIDGMMWLKDLGTHVSGEFSMAVIQANNLLEDQSQLVSGPLSSLNSGPFGTFVGVYDGHGGPETAQFVNDTLFPNLKKFASEHQEVSASVIKKAFMATEEQFLSVVREQWHVKPQLASVGTCCLVGIICNGLLYVANAGDSRVVLGRADRGVTAIQLSTEHNASIESVRDELRSMHPDDSQIVVLKHKVWRVKGIIQISRSIGDAYLKKAEFNREPLLAKFRLPEPFIKPILSPEPSILIHKLNSKDQFLIFASDGLWEHLSNQEAVDIVHGYPRNGIGGRLVKAALRVAAKKREMRYSDLKKIDKGVRRHFHDDITVVVAYVVPAPRTSEMVEDVDLLIRRAERCLEAGADMIMIDADDVCKQAYSLRGDIIAKVIGRLGLEKTMFEASNPKTSEWFVKQYGPRVNLFVDHSQVMDLECLRGLNVGKNHRSVLGSSYFLF